MTQLETFKYKSSMLTTRSSVMLSFVANVSALSRSFIVTTKNIKGTSVEKKNQLDATECFYCNYNLLNMFRALICPSSGARDYTCVVSAYGV